MITKKYSKIEIEDAIQKAINEGMILDLLPGFVPSDSAVYDIGIECTIDEAVELLAEAFYNSQK